MHHVHAQQTHAMKCRVSVNPVSLADLVNEHECTYLISFELLCICTNRQGLSLDGSIYFLKSLCECSFVQHASKGASAAVALISWDKLASALQLALLLQPTHPPVPLLRHPELQAWHGTTLFPTQSPDAVLLPSTPGTGPPEDDMQGAACGISSVLQAWHPTGIPTGSLPCSSGISPSLAAVCCIGFLCDIHIAGFWHRDNTALTDLFLSASQTRVVTAAVSDHHQQPFATSPCSTSTGDELMHGKEQCKPLPA